MTRATTTRLALAAACTAGLVGLTTASAQQQGQNNQNQQAAGQAQIREMTGPTFDLKSQSPGHMVVLFPDAQQNANRAGQQQGAGDLQLVLIEKEMASQNNGQGNNAQGQANQQAQQGEPRTTGREIQVSPSQAVEGLVSHKFDNSSNARQYMIVTRGGGDRQYDIRQSGGGDGVTLFRVQVQPDSQQMQQYEQEQQRYQEQMQAFQQQQQAAAQQQAQQAQQQANAQQQGGENQQAENQQAEQGENAQLASGADTSGQQAQQGQAGGQQMQQPEQPQRPGPTDVAVIVVYTGSSQQ